MFPRHPRLVLAIGGALFALALPWFGGGSRSTVGVVLAVAIGAVFALAMYRGLKARSPRA